MRNTWPRARSPYARCTGALLRWACLSLCYLALAGTLSRAEGIAAALTGGFAAALSLGLRAEGERRLSLRGGWVAVLARTAWLLARDTGRVGATLWSAIFRAHRGQVVLDSEWVNRPLGSGPGHRAVTALLASLTPNSVALEPGDEAIAVHELSRSESPRGGGRAR